MREMLKDIGLIGATVAPLWDWTLFPLAVAATAIYATRAWVGWEKARADVEEYRLLRDRRRRKRLRKTGG